MMLRQNLLSFLHRQIAAAEQKSQLIAKDKLGVNNQLFNARLPFCVVVFEVPADLRIWRIERMSDRGFYSYGFSIYVFSIAYILD